MFFLKTFGLYTENLYLCGWKGVQVKLGRGLMATPIFYFPASFFFLEGFYARAGAIRGRMRMRTREASPFSSVNPRHENVRIASDAFGLQGYNSVPMQPSNSK